MPGPESANGALHTTRVALVTGGAQGIGRAVALRLASDGLDVAIADLQSKLDALEGVVKEIVDLGRKSVAVTGDVSNEQDVKAIVDKVVSELGRLDVMVANAGIGSEPASIVDFKIENWDRIWAVNIRGTALSYKYAAIQMVKQGSGGRIIGACSIGGKKGLRTLGGYCASKFAIRALTQSAASDLDEHGITVNAYAPGIIYTPLTARPEDEALGGPCEGVKKVFKMADAKVGQPEMIASAVSYLASLEARFVTGQTINICGGLVFD